MARAEREKPLVQKQAKSRIPRFKTIEEAAEFWDTHDSVEFEDQFEPAEDVRFILLRGRPKKPLTVRLPDDTLAALTKQAHELGVGPSTLVRMWVLERLREQDRHKTP